jgi:predicted secreted protein
MSDERIRVQPGDTFEVTLREPAASGHRWRLADAPAEVDVVDERYEPPAQGGPLGGRGQRIVTLRATGKGRHQLTFELARPWEQQPVDEHHVDVNAG